ncbi:aminoacyl tRNA synthase complex-interacting multifunctional protein 2 isoform X2 [Pseudomyrmex gracilis]|uniref:aminoacyl tRNA synthase complex-interacting multifunctional protein 2 isoform X2 n=1 Tax=Pseudomyrmex gracilis TaxID=219809 RepID=UPI00099527B3|nr:aminoacyl tRNA synthase complex-interacting multifunctional protein 2 isoform X2 [Pseudomyrmex gracilis]
MYQVKSIIPSLRVIPSSQMYAMPNIHEDGHGHRSSSCNDDDAAAAAAAAETNMTVVQQQKKSWNQQDYNALEARQERILEQLADLKKQVSLLCTFLKQSHDAETPTVCEPSKLEAPGKRVGIHLVLNANPSLPPYSILALIKLWKDVSINVQTFTHSSIETSDLTESLNRVFNIFNSHEDCKYCVDITLIWKKVKVLQFVTSPLMPPIFGEANFLRYLSRWANKDYHNTTHPEAIERALDIYFPWSFLTPSLQQENNFSSDTFTNVVRTGLRELTNEFRLWSNKQTPTVADVGVWSAIKTLKLAEMIPHSLQEWYKSCEMNFTSGLVAK